MTSNPSDTEAVVHPLQELADRVADAVGGTAVVTFDTVKVTVPPADWISAHLTARDDLDLVFSRGCQPSTGPKKSRSAIHSPRKSKSVSRS